MLVVEQGSCHLYELGRAFWRGDHWDASVGVNWDLSSNALRPLHYTSADAAGLPILPGLVRYDEVAAGSINHALRFTVEQTQRAFVFPATHYASSSTDATRPPMGLRFRLKANYDLSGFHGQSLVILRALKKYGMMVADNGSNWFISGATDSRWDDDDLNQMKTVPGSAFEVVDTGPVPLHTLARLTGSPGFPGCTYSDQAREAAIGEHLAARLAARAVDDLVRLVRDALEVVAADRTRHAGLAVHDEVTAELRFRQSAGA